MDKCKRLVILLGLMLGDLAVTLWAVSSSKQLYEMNPIQSFIWTTLGIQLGTLASIALNSSLIALGNWYEGTRNFSSIFFKGLLVAYAITFCNNFMVLVQYKVIR